MKDFAKDRPECDSISQCTLSNQGPSPASLPESYMPVVRELDFFCNNVKQAKRGNIVKYMMCELLDRFLCNKCI